MVGCYLLYHTILPQHESERKLDAVFLWDCPENQGNQGNQGISVSVPTSVSV